MHILHHSIRQDRVAVPPEDWQFNEGWPDLRQFYPRYFKPAATLHLYVQNSSGAPRDITDVQFNGEPIADVCTNADFAGPVIWYRSNPEQLEPGGIGLITVRLRHDPTDTVTVSVGDTVAEFANAQRDQIRFGYVGFNDEIDRIYAYVEKWNDDSKIVASCTFDGTDVTAQTEFVNPDFSDGAARPALIEITLDAPLPYGSYHYLCVTTAEGETAMCEVRSRDAQYRLGMWPGAGWECQGAAPVSEYYAKFFNNLYIPSEMPDDYTWDPDGDANRLGFTITTNGTHEDIVRRIADMPPDRIVYTNVDEPDAHEPPGLPYMQRCGINIMQQVEPLMRTQRRLDPHHHTTVIVDRTYAPLNWLTYGDVPDIFMSDCYVPERWMGFEIQSIAMQLDMMNGAIGPRPIDLMIWGTMNTGYPKKRSPTPEENDMMVHYAIAEGAKGIWYFRDWDAYPIEAEGGYFIGAHSTNMQWKTMGRMNAEIARLASLLSKGHPFQIATADNDQLYVRSLLCGRDTFVVVMVNRSHRIDNPSNNAGGMPPFIFPVESATVELNLPSWFETRAVVRVAWDETEAIELTENKLQIDNLMTSMVVVISQNAEIADQLTLPEERLTLLRESEKPTYVTDAPPIAESARPDSVIAFDTDELTLDLTAPETLERAARITIDGGEIRQVPGAWLGLFAPKDWHGEAEVVFRFESKTPLKKVRAILDSSTPNIAAAATNAVGIATDRKHFTEACTLKMEWPGYGELAVEIDAPGNEPIRIFDVLVRMSDPGIVYSDEATNLVNTLKIRRE